MFCTHCGQPLQSGDKTCSHCGMNLLEPGSVRMTRPDADQTAVRDAITSYRPSTPAGESALDHTAPMPSPVSSPVSSSASGSAARSGEGAPWAAAGAQRGVPDPSVGDLPAEWFRPESDTTAPTRVARSTEPRPALVEAAPGQPAAPAQRRYHERWSSTTVFVLALVPVIAVGWLLWHYLRPHTTAAPAPAPSATMKATARTTGNTTAKSTSAAPATSAARASSASSPRASASSASASSASASAAQPPSGATACSSTVWVSGTTSCGFGRAVGAKVASQSGSSYSVRATSPVTHTTYTMACTVQDRLATCTGGRAAVVYVRAS